MGAVHSWTMRLDGAALPDRALVGGKAWSIARMMSLGLNVPPAFVVTTAACTAFTTRGGFPDGLLDEVSDGIAWLESRTGRKFGHGAQRLLLSVRSGAAISMPGMMDTVLNLGIDEDGVAALAAETGQPDFARDTHRRFIELYTSIVLKLPEPAGAAVPADVHAQLHAAIGAVFDSWNSRRAKRYRQHNKIPDDLGTAVAIQAMVFGNLDSNSGTGVLFSRNPLSGAPSPFGEYLPCAQGEDVVSGKFTPLPLDAMQQQAPAAHAALLEAASLLERENGDVQDIEFTVQRGALFLLQSRSAKRSPEASVRCAVDMVEERLIDEVTALGRVSAEQAQALLTPRLAPGAAATADILLRGEGACPGVAYGMAVADPDEAERRAAAGEDVVLVRQTTSPDDIHGMIAARAVVTAQGGATSHAAVVSRALGRPCVVGGGDGATGLAGSWITVDGAGIVYAGRLEVEVPREDANPWLVRLLAWAQVNSPVTVLPYAEAPAGLEAIDLDHHPNGADIGQLAALLAGQRAARGAILCGAEAARIAYRAGVEIIVTSPVLPALLAVIAAAKETRHGG